MHIEEFRKWVSPLRRFPEGTSVEQIDQDVDAFINEVIEPNKLAFDGSGYLAWEGLICTGSGEMHRRASGAGTQMA